MKKSELCSIGSEPYEISERFYRVLKEKAEGLERDAERDMACSAKLQDEGHRRRQRLLVIAELKQAVVVRKFLAASRVISR